MNKGDIAVLLLLRTLLAIFQKSREQRFCEKMDSFVLLAYASLAASRTLLQWLLAFLNIAAQAAENHADEWSLTDTYDEEYIYIYIYIYIYMTKFTSISRSTESKDILPWNIYGMITKIVPVCTRITLSSVMKWSILFWVCWKVNGNWDNNMIRISQWQEKFPKKINSHEFSKEVNPKEWNCENHSLGFEQES